MLTPLAVKSEFSCWVFTFYRDRKCWSFYLIHDARVECWKRRQTACSFPADVTYLLQMSPPALVGRMVSLPCCSVVVNVFVLLAAQCQLQVDTGFQCGDYVQLWFFDKDIDACSPFWYGGCGGNANRFSTEHECLRTCGRRSKSLCPATTITNTNNF